MKYKLVNNELVEFSAEDYAFEEAERNKVNLSLYKEQRAAEYPSIADQLDILYHQGFDAWKAIIATIKAKYPKPDSGNSQ